MSKYPFRHDHFFKHFFQIREVALEHVRDYLPPAIVARLDLSSFALDPTVHVGEGLQETRSDLAYGCLMKNGRNLKTVLLHEHKSEQPELDVRFQVIHYISDQWRRDKQQGRPPAFVLPLVIYNGKTKWKKQPFKDSFPDLPEEFLPFLTEFDYLLLDLRRISDEEIIRRSPGKMLASALLAMKHGFEADYFRKNFKKVVNFDWKKYSPATWQPFLRALMSYISSATGFTKNDFQELAKPLPKPLNSFIMVTMESILEEGKKEGIEIGKKEERLKKEREFVTSLISSFPKMTDEKIAFLTKTSIKFVAKVRKEIKAKKTNGSNGKSNNKN
ncbi:MAG TPA: hypothetical protein ENJ95_03890 [Bacteroidetes bacterium]|nr:hypothetical protein [Bacteroidota bacterium]